MAVGGGGLPAATATREKRWLLSAALALAIAGCVGIATHLTGESTDPITGRSQTDVPAPSYVLLAMAVVLILPFFWTISSQAVGAVQVSGSTVVGRTPAGWVRIDLDHLRSVTSRANTSRRGVRYGTYVRVDDGQSVLRLPFVPRLRRQTAASFDAVRPALREAVAAGIAAGRLPASIHIGQTNKDINALGGELARTMGFVFVAVAILSGGVLAGFLV